MLNAIPVFPLPDHVVLPYISMPYRLFEDRYRALGHYLQDNQDLGIFIPCLKPGWESSYHGNPPFYNQAIHCDILGIQESPNGEFALMVMGTQRYRLSEVESNKPFRFSDATLADITPDMSEGALQQSLLALAADFHQHMIGRGVQADQLKTFIDTCQHAQELLNRMGHLIFSDPAVRQQYLECPGISDQLGLIRTALGHRSSEDISLN